MRSVADESRESRVRELATFAVVMARFWLVVFPRVRTELREWQRRASAIPDPQLRAQALATLNGERLSAVGAALFAATTPRTRNPALVRALVAYQVICDYLDTLAEQPSLDPIGNGAQLHRALVDAVAEGPIADHYRDHAVSDDGGYLAALVAACRESCAALPAYAAVRAAAVREASRNEVQGINHAPVAVRQPALQTWAAAARAEDPAATGDASWVELVAASSSSLAVLALIAAAADPATTADTVERVRLAYFPWIASLSSLLDSVSDRERDLVSGDLNFVGQYPTQAAAVAQLQKVTARSIGRARRLPRGERHVVLVLSMIAMQVSDADAWLPSTLPATRAVLRTADAPAMPLLLPLLRGWRRARVARPTTAPSA